MGMYSFVRDTELELREGVKREEVLEALAKWKTDKPDYEYYADTIRLEKGKTMNKEEDVVDTENYYVCADWDNMKIISYWYEGYVEFLQYLNKYLTGYISLTFETDEEMAKITFGGEEVEIEIGNMEWTKYRPRDFLENRPTTTSYPSSSRTLEWTTPTQ